MAFCPLCKVEYPQEIVICPDCEAKLTEYLPEELDLFQEKRKDEFTNYNWALFQTILKDLEADIIAGLLETNGIPVMRKYPGMSSLTKVYMGSSFGVELYVPSEKLKEAKGLLIQVQEEVRKGD